MTNEEAIQRLKEGAPFSALWDKQWEEALSMAIEALEEYDKVADALNGYTELYRKLKEKYDNLKKQNQWIPCEERLPEVGEDVFISVGGDVWEAHLRASKEYFLIHSGRMLAKTEETDAWMPLPEPWEKLANK